MCIDNLPSLRLSEINAGEYLELKRATFAEFKEKWIEQYGNGSIRPSSLATFNGFFDNHLIPTFGDKPLTSITVEHIEAFKGLKLTQPKDLVRKQKEDKESEADDPLSAQTVKHLQGRVKGCQLPQTNAKNKVVTKRGYGEKNRARTRKIKSIL